MEIKNAIIESATKGVGKGAMKKASIIGWWSGGVTSAVACKIAQDLFGDVCFIFIDTKNEDDDTMRFKADCEKWYGQAIGAASRMPQDYESIQDVWFRYNSLNVSHGAICSSELKREVRLEIQRNRKYSGQVFGFDNSEGRRAKNIKDNYPESLPLFPLLLYGYSKTDCIKIIEEAGIEIPLAYKLGLNNNNCLKTGCVQGGIGYWQKYRELFPDRFEKMAQVEHELTNRKGEPVTMLKDQSKGGGLVFLLPHPDYPEIKDLSMMKGKPPKPLMECNGFCGTNDFNKNETENEINFAT